MKFIHTADWHLGKIVHGVVMTEEQRYVLEQFVSLCERERPDAVVIAGDLYDRSVPPTPAVELLHDVFQRITHELEIPILAIAGNHDSAERIHFGSELLRKSGLHVQGKLTNRIEPVEIAGVHFYLIPYAEPAQVRQVLEDASITTHHDAMRAIIERISEKLDRNVPNVFVGHAFVLGGETSDSERVLAVGGSGCVGAEIFSPFQYTALGHLHSRTAIQHPTVYYSGSLMKYSFSEAKHEKSVQIVELDETGAFHIRYESLQPRYDMRELEGYLEELLNPSYYQLQKRDDYLKITLLDEGALLDPIGKLRVVYPSVLHLERKIENRDLKKKQSVQVRRDQSKTTLDLFKDFYKEVTEAEFTDEKEAVIVKVLEKAVGEEGK